MQILIFGFALTNEVKNSRIIVVDYAKDIASQQVITKIEASNYFEIERSVMNKDEIEAAFKKGKIKLAIVFPAKFNESLVHMNMAQVQVIADASDPNTANTLTNYVSSILQEYQNEIRKTQAVSYRIIPETRML